MSKIRINKTTPIFKNVINEPIPEVTFEQFWEVWDELMDRGKIQEATIFLQQRYNSRWNEGKKS